MNGLRPSRGVHGRVFVLGNGPSLRGIDLTRFNDVTTIGMNAAYRHWERVGWYPTHYCCLDEELTVTHHEAIRDLVVEGLVESAFLTAGFLEYHPEFAHDPRFVFIDSYIRTAMFDARANRFELPRLTHPVFTRVPGRKVMLTTGGFAIRYAIFLGADEVYTIGIDANYVEIIDQAKRVGEYGLVITETPTQNPNYFFDDYQQAGDRFNIPNPAAFDGLLHTLAIESVRDDVVDQRLGVRLFNCARQSRLNSEGILPFAELDAALGEHRLSAVAVPVTRRDVDQILANLQAWNTPAQCPVIPATGTLRIPLVIVFNGFRDAEIEDRIRVAFAGCDLVGEAFSEIRFEYCELEGERDAYERDYRKPIGPHGYKAGPNHQFFAAMRFLEPYGRYTFYMEVDCIPLRPDWLGQLHRLVEGQEPFWVLGSIYRGVKEVFRPGVREHINGNAVYAAGDPEFQSFLVDTWRPSLERLLETDPTVAYDCVLSQYFDDARTDPVAWRVRQATAARFRYTDYIQNVSAGEDLAEGTGSRDALRDRSPSTFVVHGRHFAGTPASSPTEVPHA